MSATTTTTSTWANTRPARTPGSSEDHYLDIEVRTGSGVRVADVDELLEAVRHGLLTPEVAEQAVRRAMRRRRGSGPKRL